MKMYEQQKLCVFDLYFDGILLHTNTYDILANKYLFFQQPPTYATGSRAVVG